MRGVMGNQPFKLPVIAGKTFTKHTIQIDGTRFENCKFIECTIRYSGGPAEASACEFSPNTVWDIRDAAGLTIMVLQQFGWRLEYENQGPLPPRSPFQGHSLLSLIALPCHGPHIILVHKG